MISRKHPLTALSMDTSYESAALAQPLFGSQFRYSACSLRPNKLFFTNYNEYNGLIVDIMEPLLVKEFQLERISRKVDQTEDR